MGTSATGMLAWACRQPDVSPAWQANRSTTVTLALATDVMYIVRVAWSISICPSPAPGIVATTASAQPCAPRVAAAAVDHGDVERVRAHVGRLRRRVELTELRKRDRRPPSVRGRRLQRRRGERARRERRAW